MLLKKINYLLLLILCSYNGYSQFTLTPPGNSNSLYTRGVVRIGTTTPIVLNPNGSIQTGRIGTVGTIGGSNQLQGIWSINNSSIINSTSNTFGNQSGISYVNGILGGAPFSGLPQIVFTSSGLVGVSIGLNGKTYFKDRMGIGTTNPQNKLEVTHGTAGNSGLRFTNLISSSPFANNTLNRSLSLNPTGDVILSNTINSVNHNLAGNVLTTTINGVNSNAITLPVGSGSSNIYNSSGSLSSQRAINLNNNNLYFEQSLALTFALRPSGNVIGQGTFFGFYDHASDRSLDPNLNSDGIFEIGGTKNRNQYSLTTGTNDIGNWTQSSIRFNNQAFNYHINPLGGNVGIGVANATAQLHTKNSVRFENLPTNTNPTSILGTDSNGNVFNYNPSLIGSGSSTGDFWSLSGNSNATASSFLGTTNSESLKFRVGNAERLQIINSGRFHVSNTSGGNTNLFFGQDAGNDSVTGSWNIGIGPKALFNNSTGGANVAVGDQALTVNTTGIGNHGIGYRTLLSNTTGNNNTAVGFAAGSANVIGNENVFLGSGSGGSSTGHKNIFLGFGAGHTLTAGNNNIFIGDNTFPNISSTGSNQLNIADKIYGSGTPGNTSIGIGVPNPQANFHTKGTARLENLPNSATLPLNVLGTDSNGNVFNFNPSLIGGSSSSTANFWSLNGNSLATGNEFIGTTSGHDVIFKRGNVFSGRLNTDNTSFGVNSSTNVDPSSDFNTTFGVNNLTAPLTGDYNVAVGGNNLQNNTSGNSNIALGNNTLLNNTVGSMNIGIGYSVLNANIDGSSNTAVGNFALQANIGNSSTAFGDLVLVNNTSGSSNNAFGKEALFSNTIGDNNVAIGNRSGYSLQNGSNNVFIGNNVQPLNSSINNYLNIGDKIFGTQTGNDVKIGINVPNPNNTLEIKSVLNDASGLRFTNLNSSSPFIANTTNKSLSLNSTGDVVLSNTINTINNNVTGNQFTTTINGVSSVPITLPEQHLEPVLIDSYIGTRLRPVSPTMNGFNIKKNTNTVIGYRAINPNTTGNAAASAIGVGINDTNEYADLTYIAHFGPNYYVPKFAGNGGLLSDKELFIGTYGANKNIDFVTGNSFTTTQSRFKIESDNISSLSYPNTRNDLAANTPVNFIYTDTNGKFLSAPVSALTTSTPSTNIYNSNGALTGVRTLDLNSNRLDFQQISSMRVRLNPAGYKVGQGPLLEAGSYNTSGGLDPNLGNDGIFSINTIFDYQVLTTGANRFGYWTQAANSKARKPLNYHINPLGGNVGIGVQNATAQLHTLNSVRFEGLPFATEKPNAILGTDAQGNVFNYDPSIFGSGSSGNAWLLNGNSATNPGTGLGENFVGTIDAKDLVFGVNSDEKLRITQTGRLKMYNIDGANYTKNLYIGGGNENFQTSGINANTAVGLGSLSLNTTGFSNTALGFNSLVENTSGSLNCSVGINSMYKNITGSSNVSFGHNTMYSNVSGDNNTALGNQVFENKQLGSSNTAIGSFAGITLIDGTNNVLIGANTNTMSTTASNELNIGNWIFGKNGQIAIGNFSNLPQAFITNADYQLIVKRGIRTEKVRVDIASVKNWADYVFEDDYKLMSLKELDQYIKANGHLPNIPTSEEVVKDGVDLGEMNSKLLEKVEELTLHTIDLNKKNESQQKVIDDLISRLEKLEKNKKQ